MVKPEQAVLEDPVVQVDLEDLILHSSQVLVVQEAQRDLVVRSLVAMAISTTSWM